MDTQEIIILLWDSRKNFEENKTSWGFYNDVSNIFKNVYQFQSENEFNTILNSIDNKDKLIFCCHVNFGDITQGFYLFKNSRIEKEYNIPDIYYISSGGDDAETMLRDKNLGKINVRQYNEFERDVQLDKIKSFNLSDLKNEKIPNEQIKKKGIFLSHSSKDRVVVEKFRDIILIQGLGYNINDIKFTSSEASGIEGGINIPNDLRDFLNKKTGFFIQFLSNNYLESRICLNEEGAGWILCEEKFNLPLILPPSKSKSISWIKNADKGINIDDHTSLKRIYFDRKDFFESERIKEMNFTEKVDEFVKWYKNSY